MRSSATQRIVASPPRSAIAWITFAQLFATSLWFSANSAAFDLMQHWQIGVREIGWLTNAVQAGFICGTFMIAATGIADRFPASRIFSLAAILGALFHLCFAWLASNVFEGMLYRFCVGISLAGIYPIGMKLAVQWAPEKKAQVLSLLIAMLTLGTALPYGLNGLAHNLDGQYVMSLSSLLAVIAAWVIYRLGDAHPTSTIPASSPQHRHPFHAFKIAEFRAAAFGYFGHMWELYAFWTIVPLLIARANIHQALGLSQVSLLAFFVISCGALGCLTVAWLNQYISSARLAIAALMLSTLCCIAFALGWTFLPAWALLLILALWGTTVIADSPQFSALSAQACPAEQIGAALAIQNAIGFSITIVSIGLLTSAFDVVGIDAIWILVIGPILGVIGFCRQHSLKNAEQY